MRESIGYKVFKVLNIIILLFIIVITLFPFLNIVAISFSSQGYINTGQVTIFPKGFNIDTYNLIIGDKMFWINYRNTIVYTVSATTVSMIITIMFAYALSKKRLVGRKYIISFAVFTMFFNGGLIPNYLLVRNLGMVNTIWAVIIPNAMSIYNMLIMKSFFENMPEELEEAASIDGLNTYGMILRIVLPLSKAVLATMILFYAVANWNAWFSAFLYLDKKELFPVTIYLRNLIMGSTTGTSTAGGNMDNLAQVESNIKAVTIVLTTLPIITIYPFIQKYFVSGVMLGSVKQ